MSAVAAPSLYAHGDDHIGPQRADQSRVIAYDLLPAPLGDRFLRIERVTVVDGPCEVLLGAIDAMRGQQLGGAQHGDIAEQFGADFVLAAIAAVVLHIDGAQAHSIAE
jgi:hypothetical protein